MIFKVFVFCISIVGISGVLTGGWRSISFEKVPREVLQESKTLLENKYNERSNDIYFKAFLQFDSGKKAQLQVVAGINYKFDAILAPTQCMKNNAKIKNSLKTCKVAKGKAIRCEVIVNHRAWVKEGSINLVHHDCKADKKFLSIQKRSSSQNHHQIFLDHELILGGGDSHDIGTISQFEEFIKIHEKKYSTEEYKLRYKIFSSNMKRAFILQQLDMGDARYGATSFADLTEEEFRKFYLTPEWDLTKRPSTVAADLPVSDAPSSFDWREKGAVTHVKNQGQCGSCWAFSTTGNIEGQWFIKKQKLVSLSEQELVDCDKVDQGCGGGLPSNAYKEIIRIGGLETEANYPYRARNMKCSFNKTDVAANINGSLAISKDEGQIAAWLAANGPISIGINAAAMQFYMGGISHPWAIFCNPARLDHGVLIVGYGMKGTEPYWIIKNSWGPSWGEKGYYLAYRGSGVCGLNTMCTSAIVK